MNMRLTETAMERIARVLSRKYGIRVKCQGTRAYTDGKTIYLPSLPPLIDDEKLLTEIRSFLDHEVGHIKWESDVSLLPPLKKAKGQLACEVLQILEDIRTESRSVKIWPGAEINLTGAATEFLSMLGDLAKEKDPQAVHPVNMLRFAMLCRGRKYPMPDWIDQKIVDFVDSFPVATIPTWAKTAKDVVPLAGEIADAFRKLVAESERPDSPPETQGEPGEGEPGEQGGEPGEEQEGEGEGVPGEGGDEGEEDQEGEGEGAGEGGQEDGEDGDGEGEGDKGDKDEPTEEKEEGGRGGQGADLDAAPVRDLSEYLADKVKEAIEEAVAESADDPASRDIRIDFDGKGTQVEDITNDDEGWHPRKDALRNLEQITKGGVFQNRLRQLLQSEGYVEWNTGRTRGQVDPARLSALAAKTDNRVMRRRRVAKGTPSACALLVDASGSMYGHQMYMAMEVAAAFCRAIELGGHASQVTLFDSHGSRPTWQARTESMAGIRFNGAGTRLRIAKRWNQRLRNQAVAFDVAKGMGDGGTPMGAAMGLVGCDLLGRPEKRKVLMVFGDGEPGDGATVKYAMKFLRKQGVEVVLIGINTNCMSKFDKNAVKVSTSNGAADLGRAVMQQLEKALHLTR